MNSATSSPLYSLILWLLPLVILCGVVGYDLAETLAVCGLYGLLAALLLVVQVLGGAR